MISMKRLVSGLAVAGALAVTAPAAQAANLGLVFEEVSSTILICTVGCEAISGIANIAADHWQVTWAPGMVLWNVGSQFAWEEPELGFYNIANLQNGFFDVFSDVAAVNVDLFSNFCNPQPAGVTCLVAQTGNLQDTYFMTIVENAEVPEPATLALLGLGLAGLGFSRRRKVSSTT